MSKISHVTVSPLPSGETHFRSYEVIEYQKYCSVLFDNNRAIYKDLLLVRGCLFRLYVSDRGLFDRPSIRLPLRACLSDLHRSQPFDVICQFLLLTFSFLDHLKLFTAYCLVYNIADSASSHRVRTSCPPTAFSLFTIFIVSTRMPLPFNKTDVFFNFLKFGNLYIKLLSSKFIVWALRRKYFFQFFANYHFLGPDYCSELHIFHIILFVLGVFITKLCVCASSTKNWRTKFNSINIRYSRLLAPIASLLVPPEYYYLFLHSKYINTKYNN